MRLVPRRTGAIGTRLGAAVLRSQAAPRTSPFGPPRRSAGAERHFHAKGNARMSNAEALTAKGLADVKPFEAIPGPEPLPIIGNLWRFLPRIGEYHGLEILDLQLKFFEKYGPIVRLTGVPGRPDMVLVHRGEDVEVVYRNEGPWPSRGSTNSISYYREVTRKDYYGDACGVLCDNGPRWLDSRRKANPPLMQPRISRRYTAPIADVAQEFLERIRTLRDHKDEMPADFHNELFKWSLESIAYVALDTRLGCLAPVLTPDSEPQRMIDAVSVFFECLSVLEMELPLWRIYPTRAWRNFVKSLDTFIEISVKYVEEAVERVKRRQGDETEPSVLERLLERSSAKQASIMAQDMMLGGVDTTSYSLASTLYLLSKNQEKQDMLLKELKRYLPKKGDSITEEMLDEMKYLKAIIKEALRLEPPFHGGFRVMPKEIILGNYRIPAGMAIVISGVTKFSEEIYPQSKRFVPERWLKSRPTESSAGSAEDFDAVNKTKRQPFTYLPFGFGPRSCIGKRFAEMEIEIMLAKIVRNFRVEYQYGEMKYESKILNKPKDPLRFKMTERDQ